MDYSVDVVGDMVAGAASHYCFDHTPFGGIVIPTLRRAVSRTPKGAVLSGPTGVLLQMSDIKLIPNAPYLRRCGCRLGQEPCAKKILEVL
jgi:hypothetical protein